MKVTFAGAEKHYASAVAAYSRAIDINPENAVYYSNRAAAHVRLENFGLALSDATKAIELDPKYVKVSCNPPPRPVHRPLQLQHGQLHTLIHV